MKRNKIGIYVSLICIVLLLTACQSAAAKEVQQQIASIGEVTEASGTLLTEIRTAYEKLDEKERKTISNYDELKQAEEDYNLIFAKRVMKLIDEIGEVDLTKQGSIRQAREAYDNLSLYQQTLVDNSEELTEAEEQYILCIKAAMQELSDLEKNPKTVADIEQLQEYYETLTDAQKRQAASGGENTEQLFENAKIEATRLSIASVSYKKGEPDETQLEEILAAMNNYEALTSEQRDQVGNKKHFESVLEAYQTYRKKDVLYIREQYIDEAQAVEYEELLEYAKDYKKKQIALTVEIQSIKKGTLFQADSVTAVISGTEDKIYLKDGRKVEAYALKEGDTLTVYGVLEEIKKEKIKQTGSGVLGTNILAQTIEETKTPVVKITYTSKDNLGVLASGEPSHTDESVYQTLSTLKKELDAKIEKIK